MVVLSGCVGVLFAKSNTISPSSGICCVFYSLFDRFVVLYFCCKFCAVGFVVVRDAGGGWVGVGEYVCVCAWMYLYVRARARHVCLFLWRPRPNVNYFLVI